MDVDVVFRACPESLFFCTESKKEFFKKMGDVRLVGIYRCHRSVEAS